MFYFRLLKRALSSVAAFAISLIFFMGQTWAQTAGQPSRRKGDWPYYFADAKGTRYSPQDQINASNFNQLEVAWHFKTDNLGARPEYKLEGTPLEVNVVVYTTAGSQRAAIALDARTGELKWMHSVNEGRRAANAPRQLSGRGLSYWTDGNGDERILYVTAGYRLIELNSKTGMPIKTFGTDGIVDMKVGAVTGVNKPIDLETGEFGLFDRANGRRRFGQAFILRSIWHSSFFKRGKRVRALQASAYLRCGRVEN